MTTQDKKEEGMPPRRIRLDLMEPAEKLITEAIWAIEKIGADVRLTNAQNLLKQAKDLVSDVIDEQLADESKKYPIGGFAPGSYYCTCCSCGKQFQGDKRAVQCEPCAIVDKEKFDALSPQQQEEVMKANAKLINHFIKNKINQQ